MKYLGPRAKFLFGAAAALGATALVVSIAARRAEKKHPPPGKFVHANGVALHFLEQGTGQDVVFVHGLGALVQDFELSGILGAAGARYHVVAFDRPGCGFSERPRKCSWTVEDQADLLWAAVRRLGLQRPLLVGHSKGALIALAMALGNPAQVGAVVLLSGYYYPTPKPSLAPFAAGSLPLLGDFLRYTILPAISWAGARAFFSRAFSPSPVPDQIVDFPLSLALRPSQLRATAEDAADLRAAAARLSPKYPRLRVPAIIVAGVGDKLVGTHAHSERVHGVVSGSELYLVDAGHMVHYSAPRHVLWGIDRAAHLANGPNR